MLTPTKAESVCKRVISYDVGVIGTVTAVPLEGVSVIPATGSVKLSIETPAGGRSKRVILKFALPPPQFVMHPPFFRPLQDAKRKTAGDKVKTANAFIFITHPRSVFNCQSQCSSYGTVVTPLEDEGAQFLTAGPTRRPGNGCVIVDS